MGTDHQSVCSQWLARCRVTIQRCSAAPAPKLSGTEKLLLCHRLTPRRSFFPDWQRVIIIIIINRDLNPTESVSMAVDTYLWR